MKAVAPGIQLDLAQAGKYTESRSRVKRIFGYFSASILISSEKAMPSETSFISSRMDRRKTHMPDCESRTQRKYSSDIARRAPGCRTCV